MKDFAGQVALLAADDFRHRQAFGGSSLGVGSLRGS
jgi:hypothetical protein